MKKRGKWKRLICVLTVAAMCLCGCDGPASTETGIGNTENSRPIFGEETLDADSSTAEDVAGTTEADTSGTTEESVINTGETETSTSEEEPTEDPFITADDTVYALASLNVRAIPGTDGEIVGTLEPGEAVHRIGIGEVWMRIEYNGRTAYVHGDYVSETEPTEPETAIPPVAVEGTGILYDNGGYLVAIDPGHQGRGNSELEPNGPGSDVMKAKVSSGTAGVSTGIAEHVLNLTVSLYLRDELLARGYSVLMIRETADVNISNAQRAELANSHGADVFIRVHANSHSDASIKGALTMCMTPNNPYNGDLYDTSRRLSELVLDGICEATGAAKKSIIETDTMSGINWCETPVTIVEMGFMSNAEEDEAMAKDSYRRAMARGMADGIDAYFGR